MPRGCPYNRYITAQRRGPELLRALGKKEVASSASEEWPQHRKEFKALPLPCTPGYSLVLCCPFAQSLVAPVHQRRRAPSRPEPPGSHRAQPRAALHKLVPQHWGTLHAGTAEMPPPREETPKRPHHGPSLAPLLCWCPASAEVRGVAQGARCKPSTSTRWSQRRRKSGGSTTSCTQNSL